MARRRNDPISSPASGMRAWEAVFNRDPGRHYVWANPNCDQSGVASYLALGYEVETYRKDGPQPKVTRTLKDGDEITVKGQVLMSCPIDHRLGIEAEWAVPADALEKRILKPGGVDGLRGHRRGMEIVNETSDNFIEGASHG